MANIELGAWQWQAEHQSARHTHVWVRFRVRRQLSPEQGFFFLKKKVKSYLRARAFWEGCVWEGDCSLVFGRKYLNPWHHKHPLGWSVDSR